MESAHIMIIVDNILLLPYYIFIPFQLSFISNLLTFIERLSVFYGVSTYKYFHRPKNIKCTAYYFELYFRLLFFLYAYNTRLNGVYDCREQNFCHVITTTVQISF